MPYELDQFIADCRSILSRDPGPKGREEVRSRLEHLLQNPDFVRKHCEEAPRGLHVLYDDKDLGFQILAHINDKAREGVPHDHGASWAIYGQAIGETVMSDWDKLAPASESEPGKVRLRREYTLTPGMAYVYNEGDLHSPRRAGSTRLIRIEGRDVTKIRRFAYERVA